jgi:hypothetical protein
MAIALTTATVLALAGLLAVSADGFLVASAIHSAAPAAGHLVTRHVGYSIPTVLLSLFSQSMVLFYFIGTGRLVKDEIASYPEADRRAILRALARFKGKTSPPATFALVTSIAVFVLGGAVHTHALPPWTHLAASAAAIATHAWAIAAEWETFGENHRLMADPRAYVKRLT